MLGRPLWILLGGSIVVAGCLGAAVAAETVFDGQVIEEFTHDQVAPGHEIHRTQTTPPCCAPPDLADTHYLIVSTMDGKIKALDVARGGAVAWEANFDAQPLMDGTLGRVQPMKADERDFHLVPALDGSLYMYSLKERILEPIPLNTDALLQASVKIGHEAVAGGRTVTTTGIDPVTGKVRYHCSSAQCENNEDDDVHATLVFKRSSHAVRAIDAFTGRERWNLSVAEYEATLLLRNRDELYPGRQRTVRYLVRPPEGIISAYGSCGEELWSHQVGSHIAHLWELNALTWREVSLFESRNIHTLSVEDELDNSKRTPFVEAESLFYVGTCNSMPFIIHSPRLKNEAARLSASRASSSDGKKERQLVPALRNTYFVEPRTLVDMITSSFKESYTTQVGGGASNKQVAVRTPREIQASNRDEFPTLSSCPNADGVALIGQSDIRSARFPADPDADEEDDGFFVMGYTSPRRSWYSPRGGFAQCGIVNRLKISLRVEETVSGWWRAIALTMVGFVGFISVFIVRWFKRPRQSGVVYLNQNGIGHTEEVTDESHEGMTCVEPNDSSSVAEVPMKVKSTTTYSTEPPTPPGPVATRSSNLSGSESSPFESKFVQDYEVLRVLGKGGYGVVFAARNKIDAIVYAVKRIAVAKSDKATERVLREVRAMAQLDHPGIIRYYHSWMERPPAHWQDEHDRELLMTLRARRLAEKRHGEEEESNMLESMSLPPAVGDSRKPSCAVPDDPADPKPTESSSFSHILERDLSRRLSIPSPTEEPPDPTSSSGSWLDETEGASDTSSSSFSSDDECEASAEIQIIKAPLKEESESIVFAESSRSRQMSAKSSSSQEVSVIEPPMVLVTAQNEDLLPSKDTKCHAYVYIQMQLCQSRTLSDWLKRHATREQRELARMRTWFAQLVAATDYIHEQGLIHRDIKPQNIFFASDDNLKIGDMGLVSKNVLLEDESSGSSSSRDILHTGDVGTKSYMSPEQLAHKPYTFKVDVFSLGVVFFEMVVPFSTAMERLSMLAHLQKGNIPSILDGLPMEKSFISWLCAFDPAKRPTCAEVLQSAYLRDGTRHLINRARSMSRRFSVTEEDF